MANSVLNSRRKSALKRPSLKPSEFSIWFDNRSPEAFNALSASQQRKAVVDELSTTASALLKDYSRGSPPGTLRDESTPLWRRLVEAVEALLRHKLLRDPRRRGSGDPGVVFEGLDDDGMPPERSDLYYRYLEVLVSKMTFDPNCGDDPEWPERIAHCQQVAEESELPPGCAHLGWGRGRLLVMELLACGEMSRVAEAMGSEDLRPLSFEHYGNAAAMMDSACREKALAALATLKGVPSPLQHWAILLKSEVAEPINHMVSERTPALEAAAPAAAATSNQDRNLDGGPANRRRRSTNLSGDPPLPSGSRLMVSLPVAALLAKVKGDKQARREAQEAAMRGQGSSSSSSSSGCGSSDGGFAFEDGKQHDRGLHVAVTMVGEADGNNSSSSKSSTLGFRSSFTSSSRSSSNNSSSALNPFSAYNFGLMKNTFSDQPESHAVAEFEPSALERTACLVVESLLEAYGASSVAYFMLADTNMGAAVSVTRKQSCEISVHLRGAGKKAPVAVAWQFNVLQNAVDFTAEIKRLSDTAPVTVHPVTRHALGDNCPTESFYEAPELCHLILKWHAQKSKMIVGPCKFEHRMVAVDPAGVERCKVLNLASRIAASWCVVGAVAMEAQRQKLAAAGGAPLLDAAALLGLAATEAAASLKAASQIASGMALELLHLKKKEHKGDACTMCKKTFNMLTLRPHKCQVCARYFCSYCSPHDLAAEEVAKLFPANAAAPPELRASTAVAAAGAGKVADPAKDNNKSSSSTAVAPPPPKEKKPQDRERLCARCFVQAMDELCPDVDGNGGPGGSAGAQKTPYQLMELDPQFEKYFRMLKMGVMREAVALKMRENDVPSDVIEVFKLAGQDPNAAAGSGGGAGSHRKGGGSSGAGGKNKNKRASAALRQVQWTALDEASAARSVFGQLTGVGAGAVKARLTVEEELKLLEMFGTSEQLAAAAAARTGKKGGSASSGGGNVVSILDGRRTNNVSIMLKQFDKLVGAGADAIAKANCPLQDDPELAKYFKMLKMHLPKAAVAIKMTAEGLDPYLLELDPTQPRPSPSEPEALPLKEDPKFAKYFKMLQMHLPRGAVEAKMQAEGVDSSVLDLNPNKPLPPDLQIKQTASSEASKNAAAAALEGPPYYEAILPALLTLAPALTPERLAAVADMWPTDTEGKRLLGFRGSASQLSSDGERFMLWAARCGVARAKTKVEAALVVSSFEGARQRLAEDVACLAHAALRVMGSTRLQRILEILLVVGNAMNADARDEIANARGFTVESLLKLCDTKAASSRFKGTTLLDFFVSMVVERGEHDLLMYPREVMPGLTDASLKSDANVVSGDVKALASEIRRVEREYTAAVKDAQALQDRKEAAAKAKQERIDAAKRAREVAEAAKALQRTMRAVALSQAAGPEGVAMLAAAEKSLDKTTSEEEAACVRVLTTKEILKDAANIHAAAAAMAVSAPSLPPLKGHDSVRSVAAVAAEGTDSSATAETPTTTASVVAAAPTAPTLLAPFFEPSEDPIRGLNRLLTEWRPLYAQHQAHAKANAASDAKNNSKNNDSEGNFSDDDDEDGGLRMAVSICEGPGQQDFVAPGDLSDDDEEDEGAGAQVALASTEAAVAMQDDPELAKYFKMLKIHLPKAAVAMKMTAEGLDPNLLDLDPAQPRPPPPLRPEGLLVPLAEKWLEKLTLTGRFKPAEEAKPSTTALNSAAGGGTALGESNGALLKAPTPLEEAGAAAARDGASALTRLVKQHKATAEWLLPHETIVMCGAVNKRGSKKAHAYLKRVLVLTSQKRLVYLDAAPKMVEKGSFVVGPASNPQVTPGGRFEVTEDLDATAATSAGGASSADGSGDASVAAAGAAPMPRRSGIFSLMSAPSTSGATGSNKPARTYFFAVDFFAVPTAEEWCCALHAAALGQDISAVTPTTSTKTAVLPPTPLSTESTVAAAAAPASGLVEAPAPVPPAALSSSSSSSSVAENPRAGFLAEIANRGAKKTTKKKTEESNNGSNGSSGGGIGGDSSNSSSSGNGGGKSTRAGPAGGPGGGGGGGRGDLLAQIAARGKKRNGGGGGNGGGNSQGNGEEEEEAVISDGPFPEERANFQASLGEFLSAATPQLNQLEAETSEMQQLCRRFCEYFGAGGAGGVGGSSAAVLANLVRFTTELSSATSAWERKHKCTIDDLLLASSSSASGGEGSELSGSATTASGDVSVGHVVGTVFGAGVVEAVRFKDQIVVVQLDRPVTLAYSGGRKKSARHKRGSSSHSNEELGAPAVPSPPAPSPGARAFLSASSIATLGRQVFTAFGPGTVRARAEAPRPTKSNSSGVLSTREDSSSSSSEDSSSDHALSAASGSGCGGSSGPESEAIKPRYVVELAWGRIYVQPKDVKLSAQAVPPSCRVAHRVFSLAELEARRQEEIEAAQQAAEDAAAAEEAAIAAEYEAALESARAANQLAIEDGAHEEEVLEDSSGSEGEGEEEEEEDNGDDDSVNEDSEKLSAAVEKGQVAGNAGDDIGNIEEMSGIDGGENVSMENEKESEDEEDMGSNVDNDKNDAGHASIRGSVHFAESGDGNGDDGEESDDDGADNVRFSTVGISPGADGEFSDNESDDSEDDSTNIRYSMAPPNMEDLTEEEEEEDEDNSDLEDT